VLDGLTRLATTPERLLHFPDPGIILGMLRR